MVSWSIDTKCHYLIACGMLILYLGCVDLQSLAPEQLKTTTQPTSTTLRELLTSSTLAQNSNNQSTPSDVVSTSTSVVNSLGSTADVPSVTTISPTTTSSNCTTCSSMAANFQIVSTDKMPPTLDCTCGTTSTESDNIVTRIVGGSLASAHSYPWLAILRYYKVGLCSATVINTLYLLTAAHCISMMQSSQKKLEEMYGNKLKQLKTTDGVVLEKISVVLGALDKENLNDTEEFQVESFLVHPEHTVDEVHDSYDLALVRLKKHIHYSTHIQPVCLPKQGEIFDGFQAVIMGWGHTQFNGTSSRYLKHARVFILNDTSCIRSKVGSHFQENPQIMICAYEYNTDACQGDSGGPLLYKEYTGSYVQAGIVSWGIECARVGSPGVYTEVSYFTNWIKNNSKDGMFCSKPK